GGWGMDESSPNRQSRGLASKGVGMKVFVKAGLTTIGLCMFLAQGILAQGGGSGSTSGESEFGTTTNTSGSTNRGTSGEQISLQIPNESAPPGGVVQMKFIVTEPTPISSGGAHISPAAASAGEGDPLFNT